MPPIKIPKSDPAHQTRVLLRTSSPADASVVIKNILDYLSHTKNEVWNGKTTTMTTRSLNTGLCRLLTDRWLKILE
jgi:hypothetical protein